MALKTGQFTVARDLGKGWLCGHPEATSIANVYPASTHPELE